jgi:N-acetyl-alpha-D-glucosaminyl L-malate synthase BshA
MVEVASYEGLDVLHVHYAIPHAASAFLAKQILKQRAPKVITTLHGTDITLVGKEPSYLPITRFSIVESDGITAPSRYLRHATYDQLNIDHAVPIEIISNFVDTETFSPPKNTDRSQLKPLLGRCTATNKIITHVSNFRPVKRILDVIKIFEIVSRTISAHLILVGDGPERSQAENLVRELKLTERVCFIGKQDSFTPILQNSDLFLLPSESESFGLAALEAMSCGVPVVASNAGGLPEVITQGKEGFLAPIGDVEGMAKFATDILTNPKLLTELSNNARTRAVTEFSKDALISKYEDYYYKILGQ